MRYTAPSGLSAPQKFDHALYGLIMIGATNFLFCSMRRRRMFGLSRWASESTLR